MSELHVMFKVAEADYVVPADDVLHLESFSDATRVPGTAPFVVGLVQTRGRVVPVVDLRARFHLPPAPPSIDARVIVVQRGERAVGLLVDSAREVVRLAPDTFKPPPELVARQAEGFVRSVAQAGERLVMLIDFDKVISEEQVDGE